MGQYLEELFAPPQQLLALTGTQVLLNLVCALVCGVIIFLVYRFFNEGVVYSARFNMLIVMVSVVTSLIIITIGANLVLTLGMVGALSIVRFRAAVKDPLDVGFLFWAVAAGLTSGAQLYSVAVLGTCFIASMYIVISLIRIDKKCYLLIIRYEPISEEAINDKLKLLKARIKNKTSAKANTEITAEITVRKGNTSFTDEIKNMDGVETVSLVEYSGDYY